MATIGHGYIQVYSSGTVTANSTSTLLDTATDASASFPANGRITHATVYLSGATNMTAASQIQLGTSADVDCLIVTADALTGAEINNCVVDTTEMLVYPHQQIVSSAATTIILSIGANALAAGAIGAKINYVVDSIY